jgi:hypothetical protein
VKRLSDPTGLEPIVAARVRVDQWAGYGLDAEHPDDLIARPPGPLDAADDSASAEVLPAALRRRVSALGQKAFKAAYRLKVPDGARFVFCSRNGEFDRTLRILTALAGDEPVSPADFSLSVHNALAGLLSIAWRNRTGHTTIAARAKTFEAGLIESAACLMERPGEPVLMVYYDERLPEPYSEISDANESCVVLAMLLTPPRDEGGEVIIDLTNDANPAARDVRPGVRSASDAAHTLLDFLASSEVDARTSRGEGSRWRWRIGQAG